jgi:hypothetical protein
MYCTTEDIKYFIVALNRLHYAKSWHLQHTAWFSELCANYLLGKEQLFSVSIDILRLARAFIYSRAILARINHQQQHHRGALSRSSHTLAHTQHSSINSLAGTQLAAAHRFQTFHCCKRKTIVNIV